MSKIFDEEFRINYKLKLRVEIVGLIDKGDKSAGQTEWYNNSCSLTFTMLPVSEKEDKRCYTGGPIFGGEEALTIQIKPVYSIFEKREQQQYLDGIGKYIADLAFPFLGFREDEKERFVEEVREVLIVCRRAVAESDKVREYHNFPVLGMG